MKSIFTLTLIAMIACSVPSIELGAQPPASNQPLIPPNGAPMANGQTQYQISATLDGESVIDAPNPPPVAPMATQPAAAAATIVQMPYDIAFEEAAQSLADHPCWFSSLECCSLFRRFEALTFSSAGPVLVTLGIAATGIGSTPVGISAGVVEILRYAGLGATVTGYLLEKLSAYVRGRSQDDARLLARARGIIRERQRR